MRVKVFQSESVSQAMIQIRNELGPDALILSTVSIQSGVEVTVALETDDEQEVLHRLPTRVSTGLVGEDLLEDYAVQSFGYKRHNLPGELLAALMRETAESACRRLFQFGELSLLAGGPPLMLVGPPGVGKTLTVAKLATRMVLNGVPPLVITADDQRAGAVEQLAGFTKLLGVTLIVVGGPRTLERALSRRDADVPVLIDAPGLDLLESPQTAVLSELILAAGSSTALVLAAGIDPLEAVDVAASHLAFGTSHLLPTRLDKNGRLGGILAAAIECGLTLTEAGISTAVAAGLERLSPETLSHRLSMATQSVSTQLELTRKARYEQRGSNALATHILAQTGQSRSTLWKMIR